MSESETPKKKKNPFWQWFWLSFLVISVGYAWYSFYVPSNDITWAEDYASAQQLASDSGKPMLLFFTAVWCAPCRIMKRQVFADTEVMRVINAQFVPIMLDQDESGNDELFSKYKVQGPPVTIVTDASGNVLTYAVGGINKAEFLELIKSI